MKKSKNAQTSEGNKAAAITPPNQTSKNPEKVSIPPNISEEELLEEYVLPLGRPVDPDSTRQKHLASMEAKKQAQGGVLKRGRPVNTASERQQKIAERIAKIKLGLGVKRSEIGKGKGKGKVKSTQLHHN